MNLQARGRVLRLTTPGDISLAATQIQGPKPPDAEPLLRVRLAKGVERTATDLDREIGIRSSMCAVWCPHFYFEVFVVGVATIGAAVLGLAMANDSSNIFTSASRS